MRPRDLNKDSGLITKVSHEDQKRHGGDSGVVVDEGNISVDGLTRLFAVEEVRDKLDDVGGTGGTTNDAIS